LGRLVFLHAETLVWNFGSRFPIIIRCASRLDSPSSGRMASQARPFSSEVAMQYMKFHPGDMVRVRGGGPLMTVHAEVAGLLLCSWLDATGRSCRQTFSPTQLQHDHAAEQVGVTVMKRLASRWIVAGTF
jgi:uncharacterized protein YodC (DUF2158 family)